MSRAATVPAAVLTAYPALTTHPVIAEVFTPGTGWRTLAGRRLDQGVTWLGGYRKRITPAYARKLAGQGVTDIALDLGNGRTADFTARELCRAAR